MLYDQCEVLTSSTHFYFTELYQRATALIKARVKVLGSDYNADATCDSLYLSRPVLYLSKHLLNSWHLVDNVQMVTVIYLLVQSSSILLLGMNECLKLYVTHFEGFG